LDFSAPRNKRSAYRVIISLTLCRRAVASCLSAHRCSSFNDTRTIMYSVAFDVAMITALHDALAWRKRYRKGGLK
jgi:hypothetical protein